MATDSTYSRSVKPAMINNFLGALSPEALSRMPERHRKRLLSSGNPKLDELFEAAGKQFNISPNLLKALAKVASHFNIRATSKSGAMGVMQLMPGTARYLGVDDPYDPEQNIMGGARYLKEQMIRFCGNVELALAAYSAGWPAVINHGGVPPFKKTQAYVQKVLSYLGGEVNVNTLSYDGFDVSGSMRESTELTVSDGVGAVGESAGKAGSRAGAASYDSPGFNYNEALAQMLFIKLLENQMHVSGSSTTD